MYVSCKSMEFFLNQRGMGNIKFKIILNVYINGPTEPPKSPNECFIQSLKLGFGTQGRACNVHKCISAWQPAWGLVGRSQVASLSAAGQVSMLFSLSPHVWKI